MTCGNDDSAQRAFIARSNGFGSDLNGYYTSPPQGGILRMADAYGSENEVRIKMGILFAAA